MSDDKHRLSAGQPTRRAFLACGAAAILSGCATSNPSPTPGQAFSSEGVAGQTAARVVVEPVRVALLLPSSRNGGTAIVAADLDAAAELAIIEVNEPSLRLVKKDTGGSPEGAARAAEAAIADGAELILGPLFAGEVAAVAPIARKAGVPVVAFSSDRKVAGQGAYLLSFLAGDDVPRIIGYAAAAGKRRIAALIPQSDYGHVVKASLEASIAPAGASLVGIERYPLEADGMIEPMKRIKSRIDKGRIDALLVPGGADTLPMLGAMLTYHGIDPSRIKLLGTGGWDIANAGQEKALQGAWFPAAEPSGWRGFSARFMQLHGRMPARIASLGYDAASLAASLAGSPRGERYAAANLTRPSGFAGIDGLFRLRADGSSERGLAVLEVQAQGARVIEAAPSTFGAAGF